MSFVYLLQTHLWYCFESALRIHEILFTYYLIVIDYLIVFAQFPTQRLNFLQDCRIEPQWLVLGKPTLMCSPDPFSVHLPAHSCTVAIFNWPRPILELHWALSQVTCIVTTQLKTCSMSRGHSFLLSRKRGFAVTDAIIWNAIYLCSPVLSYNDWAHGIISKDLKFFSLSLFIVFLV